jgi:LPXTG-motif cell wall-anchored protein
MQRIATYACVLFLAGSGTAFAAHSPGHGDESPGNSGDHKVTICHQTGSGSVTITVDDHALEAHLGHGDTLGPCVTVTPPPPGPVPPPPAPPPGPVPPAPPTVVEPPAPPTVVEPPAPPTVVEPPAPPTVVEPPVSGKAPDADARTPAQKRRARRVARLERERAQFERLAATEAKGQLPYTGVQTGLLTLLGLLALAAGLLLRRAVNARA